MSDLSSVAGLLGPVLDWLLAFAEAGLGAAPGAVLLLLLLVTVWLASATWASSIAESRLHSPKLHFAIGLVIPVAYPMLLLFMLDVRNLRAGAEDEEDEDETEQPAAEEADVAAEEADAADAPEAFEVREELNQEYFDRISRDEAGNYVGPWRIKYEDSEIVVQRILEALPSVAVVEAVTREGATPQRMRIPYSKIVSCVRD